MILKGLVNLSGWKAAVGEVALIVLGITVALALDSWYEDRKQNLEESNILSQLEQGLTKDVEALRERIEFLENSKIQVEAIIRHISEGQSYSDDLGARLSSVVSWRWYEPNRGPYESLKARGFDLISDDSLRLELISMFEDNRLHRVNETMWLHSNDQILSYFNHKLKRTVGGWEPIDYEKLLKDELFLNLCKLKLDDLQNWMIPTYKRTTSTILALNSHIRKELDKFDST